MKKNNAVLVFIGALALVLVGVRIFQLFGLNEAGTVEPVFLTYLLYGVIAAATVLVPVLVRAKEEPPLPFYGFAAEYLLLILGVSLLVEAWCRLFLTDGMLFSLPIKLLVLFSVIAGVCFFATFISRFLASGKAAAWTAPVGFLAFLAYLVTDTVYLFIQNRTGVALTLNLLSLVVICAAIFFVKALAKEFLSIANKSSRRSLLRSALLLLAFLPAELTGQLLVRFGKVAEAPVAPLRGSIAELVTDAVLLLLALAVCTVTFRRQTKH